MKGVVLLDCQRHDDDLGLDIHVDRDGREMYQQTSLTEYTRSLSPMKAPVRHTEAHQASLPHGKEDLTKRDNETGHHN